MKRGREEKEDCVVVYDSTFKINDGEDTDNDDVKQRQCNKLEEKNVRETKHSKKKKKKSESKHKEKKRSRTVRENQNECNIQLSGYDHSVETERISDFSKNTVRESGKDASDDECNKIQSPEKNDCEIIVVNESLTEYGEFIEKQLRKLGLKVDILFPNENVPLSRMLGNIASRGCLYAIVVTTLNQEHFSLTLNILHDIPQEHRNMPVNDALEFIARDFENYKKGIKVTTKDTFIKVNKHPDSIQTLLDMLSNNRELTVCQYDTVLTYLQKKRNEQEQIEIGEFQHLTSNSSLVNNTKRLELQSRILKILNSNELSIKNEKPIVVSNTLPVNLQTKDTSTVIPLLENPTVQKALENLLEGNFMNQISILNEASPRNQKLI